MAKLVYLAHFRQSKTIEPHYVLQFVVARYYQISGSERIPHAGSYWLFLKIMVFSPFKLKFQIPYYYPLNQWLLWATNGNQGQTVMDI